MVERNTNELFLGIDFGTSKTCVAYCPTDNPVASIFEDKRQQSMFPTIVALSGGNDPQWVIGQDARGLLSGKVADSIKMEIDDNDTTFSGFRNVELAGKFLADLLAKVRERLGEPIIAGLTITVPARWSIPKRQATLFAARIAGFDCPIALLEEPLAAFLRFYDKSGVILKQHEQVLVVDFGGGTCDLSLIELSEGKPRVHKSNTIAIGGTNIDDAIARYWLRRFNANSGRSVPENSEIFQKLRFEAETTKIRLSRMVEAQSVGRKRSELALSTILDEGIVPLPAEDIYLSRNLSADELKKLIEEDILGIDKNQGLLPGKVAERLLGFLNQHDQGRSVNCVIFSGGSCRNWVIQDYLKELFRRRYGETLFFLPPEREEATLDQSVGIGAALHQYFVRQKNAVAIPTLNQALRVTIRLDGKDLHAIVFEEGENLPTHWSLNRLHIVPFARNRAIEVIIEQLVGNEYKFVSQTRPFVPVEKMTPVGEVWWQCSVNEYGLVQLDYGSLDVAYFHKEKSVPLYPSIEGYNLADKKLIHDTQQRLGI